MTYCNPLCKYSLKRRMRVHTKKDDIINFFYFCTTQFILNPKLFKNEKHIVNCSDHYLCCSGGTSIWSTGLLLDVSVCPASRIF